MRLSIVNDVLSQDLNTAWELLQEFSGTCREMELRDVGLDAVVKADPRWLEIAEKAVTARRFRVTALSAKASQHDGVLALAERLSCPLVSITPGDDESDEAIDALDEFITQAAEKKIVVALRNHPDSIAGTAVELLELLEEFDGENVGLDWDPASAMAAGDGTGLDDLEALAPRLKMLHVRDAVRKGMGAEWAPLGKGVVAWEDILDLLFQSGYRGPVVLDHGLPNKVRESKTALPQLARWIDSCRTKRPERNEDEEEEGDGEVPFHRKPRGPKRR
jgi:sugar phosphate isomerase/epimerase